MARRDGAALSPQRRWMLAAFEEARAASREGDLPVGAVIISASDILSRGRNRVLSTQDISAHAEIDAIRRAGLPLLQPGETYSIYTTAEPCLMCLGAILYSRIGEVVWAADATSYTGSALAAVGATPYMASRVAEVHAVAEPYEDLRLESRALMHDFYIGQGDVVRADLLAD